MVLFGCEARVPGETVGAFDVVGHLEENSCGVGAVPAVDPLAFPVEIRDDRGRPLWWRRGEIPVEGRVEEEALVFRRASRARVLASDPTVGFPGCTVVTEETVRVIVEPPGADAPDAAVADAGASNESSPLDGTNVAELSPEPGSDCRPLLAVFGGPWQALPCRVSYRLEGSRRRPF
jgi:hypothetical protein